MTLALEEMDENRREEELFKSVGSDWKKIARIIDRSEPMNCTKILD